MVVLSNGKHPVFPNSWHAVGFPFSVIPLASFKTSFLRAKKWFLCGLNYAFFFFLQAINCLEVDYQNLPYFQCYE